MTLPAILHGVRYGWRRFRCRHPVMERSGITVQTVGGTSGSYWCTSCGKVLGDEPMTVTR